MNNEKLDPKNGVLDRHKEKRPSCNGQIKYQFTNYEEIMRLNPKNFTLICSECDWEEKWTSTDPNNTNELPLNDEREIRFRDKYGLNLRELC